MIMIVLTGLLVGAGLALWFSVFILSPVIVIVVVLAGLAGIVGGAGVSSFLAATLIAGICLQIGYLGRSLTLWVLERARQPDPRTPAVDFNVASAADVVDDGRYRGNSRGQFV